MTGHLPRLELSSTKLADWIDKQSDDSWWLVDGDPLLTGIVSFPCPGDVLSAKLRQLDRPMLLIPTEEISSEDRSLSVEELEQFAEVDEFLGERIFQFKWAQASSKDEWLLVEDKESANWARGLDESEGS